VLTDGEMQLIGLLDGLNAVRFATDRGKLAEWQSARDVFGPGSSPQAPDGADDETVAGPDTIAGPEDVADAA
jgi:hypothetical protein